MTDTDPPRGSEGLAADHGTAARPEQQSEEHRESPPEGDSEPESDPEQVTVPLQERDVTDRDVFSTLMGERRSVAEIVRGSEFEIERRYWIQPPHVYVAILQHTEAAEYLYYVVTPSLREDEEQLYQKLYSELRKLLFRIEPGEDETPADVVERQAQRKLQKLGVDLSPASQDRVLYYLKRNIVRYDRLDPLLSDPELEMVSVNGAGSDNPVFVQHQDFGNMETSIVLKKDRLPNLIRKIAQRAGEDVSRANPVQRASLPGGSDVHLFLEDVSPSGNALTIQKQRDEPFTPVHLIDEGTFAPRQLAYLWTLVESGHSGLVVGGLSAGKTTVLNVLGMFVTPRSRVVTVEESPELQLPQDNQIETTTRRSFGAGTDDEVGQGELIDAALGNKPEYLFVGEVSGSEAQNLFRGMSVTGNAVFTSITAETLEGAAAKLEREPMGVPNPRLQELDFAVIQREEERDGERVRRNSRVCEFPEAGQNSEGEARSTWEWDREADEMDPMLDESRFVDTTGASDGVSVEEIDRRARVLEQLRARSITGFEPVTTVLRAYMVARERVMEQTRAGEYDFDELESLVGEDR